MFHSLISLISSITLPRSSLILRQSSSCPRERSHPDGIDGQGECIRSPHAWTGRPARRHFVQSGMYLSCNRKNSCNTFALNCCFIIQAVFFWHLVNRKGCFLTIVCCCIVGELSRERGYTPTKTCFSIVPIGMWADMLLLGKIERKGDVCRRSWMIKLLLSFTALDWYHTWCVWYEENITLRERFPFQTIHSIDRERERAGLIWPSKWESETLQWID